MIQQELKITRVTECHKVRTPRSSYSGLGAGISAGPAGLAVLCEPILKVAVQ